MNLDEIRDKIDSIDTEITSLFSDRMDLAAEVARVKSESKSPILNKAREREIISRVTGLVDEEYQLYVKILFSTLFDLSRSYQQKLINGSGAIVEQIEDARKNTDPSFPKKAVVACQGIEGAYSQLACDKLFSIPDIVYFKRFEGVFQAVERGLCRYGILPIENSSYGSVVEVYDLMKKYNFYIVNSVKIQVNHMLLAKRGAHLDGIKEIYSHEQALGQCSDFLNARPDVKVTVCENTAVAAQLVSESNRTDVAAISSETCSELYNLPILSADIQNDRSNFTRFICISKEFEIYPGANKISLMLSVPHRPGSLYEIIAKFSALGINLTKLESRPIPGRDFEFMFYLDMDASAITPDLSALLSDLSYDPDRFVFLGNYPEN